MSLLLPGVVSSSHKAGGVVINSVAFASGGYYQGNSATLAGTDVTWACWFKAPTVTGAYHSFLSATIDGSGYWITSINSSGFLVQDNNPTGEYTTGHSVGSNVWHYVAVVHHESSGAIEFYYGLESDSSLTRVNFTGSTGPASGFFHIGRDFFAADFLGSVAQVKIWTAALTQAEAEAEWRLTSVARTSGLWAYYSFSSGPQTTDESGNGRTLTSTGTKTLDAAGPTI